MLDERTERLITRKLDGEIREDELLELNKQLIRDPEARALLEEYERNDALAVSTLQALLRTEKGTEDDSGGQISAFGKGADDAFGKRADDGSAASHLPTFSRSHLRTFSPVLVRPRTARLVVCLRYVAGGLTAVAAALALVVFLRPAMEIAPPAQLAPMMNPAPVVAAGADEDAVASVIDGRRNAREELDQNVIGVYDEGSRSWYMLELERKRTKVTPVSMSF